MQLQPPSPPASVISRALQEFQISATSQQVAQIQRYTGKLLAWNEKLNLTAIRDPLEILYRHFCESMFAGQFLKENDSRLADVGSGGGFPGLPLKILRPDLQVLLIESNVKKATFLAEMVRELELEGARVLVSRYEELNEEVAPLDVACCRALGQFSSFLSWSGRRDVACDRVMLWVGSGDIEEIQRNAGWNWSAPVAIPHSLRRLLLIGEKARQA